MKNKILALIACFTFVLFLSGCSIGKETWVAQKYNNNVTIQYPSNKIIAENDKFRLEWDEVKKTVTFIESATNDYFGISPKSEDDNVVDEFGLTARRHPQLESALLVNYIDPKNNVISLSVSYTDAVKSGKIRCIEIDNGLKVEYYFEKIGVMIPVNYILRKDSVQITIDPKEIQEDKYRIVSISVAPFFCSVNNEAKDDYLMFPSGSGAITYAKTISNSGIFYSAPVYGEDLSMARMDAPTTDKAVRIPVFGAKIGDKALCAIIEQGADSALIEMCSGATTFKYSNVCATFQMRGYTDNIATMFDGIKVQNKIYADSMIDKPISVSYYPLVGEQASYSGMAECYRNYLKNNGDLVEREKESSLNVEIVGGAIVKKSFLGIPYDSLYATTTLSQAQEIIDDLSSQIDISNVKLLGYGSTGVDVGKLGGDFKIGSNVGNIKDLKSLIADCKEKKIGIYQDFELIRFASGGDGISTYFDSANSAGNLVAYQYDYNLTTRSRLDDTRYQLVSRGLIFDTVKKLLNKTESWGLTGVSLNSIGNLSYSDYSNREQVTYYAKNGMSNDIKESLEYIRGNKMVVSTSDANIYAALLSDVVMQTPNQSAKHNVFDEEIPFYQMILKGYVGISVESINLSESGNKQILKAVESGSGLTYTLIDHYDNCLIDVNKSEFYNSCYSDLKSQIIEQAKSLKDYYDAISKAHIINHEILKNGLRKTTFDNGYVVYVNYSSYAIESPLGVIEAQSYLIGGGDNA